jgi:hypothetical protein
LEDYEKYVTGLYEINKSLMIVKMKGIGISMVNYVPYEVAYISLEGLVVM